MSCPQPRSLRIFAVKFVNDYTMSDSPRIPVSVYAEMTPNPAVLKFVANQRLIDNDAAEFKNIDEARPSPLAVKLFHYPFVKEIFISGNYLAITKYDLVEWEDVTLELREMIRDYLASGAPVMDTSAPAGQNIDADAASSAPPAGHQAHPDAKDPAEWDALEVKIAQLLDEYVTPAVAQDGGNIKFLQYREGAVRVLLQGACSGCPSSTLTLKQGIQNLLQEMLPGQIRSVEAVNG